MCTALPPYLMDKERKCLVWSAWEEVGARVILQYNCCLVGLYCALQQCTVVCTVQYSGARWREHSHNLQVSGHWHQTWSLALPGSGHNIITHHTYKSQITCAETDSNLTNSYTLQNIHSNFERIFNVWQFFVSVQFWFKWLLMEFVWIIWLWPDEKRICWNLRCWQKVRAALVEGVCNYNVIGKKDSSNRDSDW